MTRAWNAVKWPLAGVAVSLVLGLAALLMLHPSQVEWVLGQWL